jgi:hypothetical protein
MSNTEILSTALTVVSSLVAILQYKNAVKVSDFAKAALQNAAGDVCKIQQSTEWAHNHLREIMKLTVGLPNSLEKSMMQQKITQAQGDVTAADRLTISLFNSLLSHQQSQFQTRDIRHPEKANLELWLKEVKNNQQSHPI